MAIDLPSNVSRSLGDLVVWWSNNALEGWGGTLLLISYWTIAFLSTKTFSTSRALAFSTYTTAVLATLLRILGIVGDIVWVITIIGAVIVFVGLASEER